MEPDKTGPFNGLTNTGSAQACLFRNGGGKDDTLGELPGGGG
jgi:hypothetical protein